MSKQSSPGGYLVKDFADGWYWTPNAALDHASGALVWSVADSRYETDPPALATREEAPAEAGELASQIAILRKAANSPTPDEDAGLTPESALKSAQAWRTIASNVVEAFDRAQPQAREDAQPVGWKATPAPEADPDALRELDELVSACESEFCSQGTEGQSWTYGEDDDSEVAYPKSNITFGHIRRARQALATLQAEQKGGA